MILDLKEHTEFIPQYIELRNRHSELLLTYDVEISETISWINSTTAEIRVIEEDKCLLGVVLLYIERGGEVAFFTRYQNKGLGTKLLQIADGIARQSKLLSIWAWVRQDNLGAARAFEKCGYGESRIEDRSYKGQIVSGIRFTKIFEENTK